MPTHATKAVLVGRERELGVLDDALAALADGAGGIVAVVGGAGLGKSRLLEELGTRADARGWMVLAGNASEFERDLPFAPLVGALDAYLAARAGDLDGAAPGMLGAVFPALAAAVQGAPGDVPAERHRTHRAIQDLLVRLAHERPLVLTLDDLHWADAATVELVSHLVRHPPPAPVLLGLGSRAAQASPALRATLSAIAAGRRGSHVELEPLSPEDADLLLGDDLGADVREQLYEESAGNPFFLAHLARAARHRGDGGVAPLVAAHPELEVPPAVAAALEEEVGRLATHAVTTLHAAAVAGEPFTPDLVAVVADLPEALVLTCLDELLEAALVVGTQTPREHRFAHPIVRRAAYQASPAGWRLAAHARAAGELERRGVPAPMRAHHLEQAAGHGDEQAIAVLLEAAAATAAMSPAASAHWLDAALRLLPDTPAEMGRRLDLLARRATALAGAGRLSESLAALEELGLALPESQVALRARVAAGAAKVAHLLGRHDSRDTLTEALEQLPADATADAVRLQLELASDAFFTGDFATMRDWVERARAHDDVDDPALVVAVEGVAGCAHYMVGDVATALSHLDAAALGLDQLADGDVAAHLNSLAWFAWCEAFVERFDDAEAHADRARGLARVAGQAHVLALLGMVRAYCELERGSVAQAAEEAAAAAEESLLVGNGPLRCWALALGCAAATAAGEVERALVLGAEAVEEAGDDIVSALASCYQAEALLASGDAAGARDVVLAGAGGEELAFIEEPFRPRWFALLAEAEAALGDLDAARTWLARARAAAAASTLAGREALALRAAAVVERAAGDLDAALAAAREATEAAQRAGLATERGRALLLEGELLAQTGDAKRAVERLRAAEETLAGCGAWRSRDDAAKLLRGLGHRPTAPRRAGHAVGDALLSAREAEVVELVAQGHTNKEVAADLFVSEKTVESHLANVFAKLGVTSRAAAAAAWERARAQ